MRFAINGWIDVAAAGQHQGVDPRQQVFRRLAADQNLDGLAAGAAYGLEIVLHLPVLPDGDQRHGVSVLHSGRDRNAHQIERAA